MKIVVDRDLKLRPYNNKDRAALYKNSRDCIFLKYMEYKKFSVNQFNEWLKRKKKSTDVIFFVIEYKNQPIGTYLLTISGIKKQNCDLSYGISSEFVGRRIFYRVTKKIIKKFKNIKRFSAITRADNIRSVNGLKKLKFKKEGILNLYYYDLKTKKYYNAVILSYII
jgi:RimJ/RimL family protein N-acetyltransferase